MATKTRALPGLPAPVAGVAGNPRVPATPCPSPIGGPALQVPVRQGRGVPRSGTTSVPCTPGGKMRDPSPGWDTTDAETTRGTFRRGRDDWGQVVRLTAVLVAALALFSIVAGVAVAVGWRHRVRRVQTLEPRGADGNATRTILRPGVLTGSTSAKARWHHRSIHSRGHVLSTTAVTDLDSTLADAVQEDDED